MGASLSRSSFAVISLFLGLTACERPPRETPPSPRPAEEVSLVESETMTVESEELSYEDKISEGPDQTQKADEAGLPEPRFSGESEDSYQRQLAPLKRWVQSKKGHLYVALVDLESDQWLVKEHADVPVNVASNAKVPTAAAALTLLGPAYKFKTELFGDLDDSGHCERLVLRGGGDPSLETPDLYRFVTVLKGRGLTSTKSIVVDQSLFDDHYVPPAFEQQPGEWAPFRANISALSLNQNAVSLNVAPRAVGEPARVWYEPPGVIEESGNILSSKQGSGDKVQWSLSAKSDPQRLHSIIGGSLSVDSDRRRYSRRLEDPRLAPGLSLARLLIDAGIEVGPVTLGQRKAEGRLALWYSEPLAELVRALGKDSDNFFAEMLLVALSQVDEEKPAVWSSSKGANVLGRWLKELGMWVDGTVVKNGSGLFDANRYSVGLLVSVLSHIEDNPKVYFDFASHLAMGATDGTMQNRMKKSDLAERVRAKTGTLRDVDALSGYIGRPGGRSPLAFSVVVQGVQGHHGEVRKRVDSLVLEWASLSAQMKK